MKDPDVSAAGKVPAAQRVEEWSALDERALHYHLVQWEEPKRSTVHFAEFVRAAMSGSGRVVDLGCGAGAATAFLAAQYPSTHFLGIDLSPELVAIANKIAHKKASENLSFKSDDWYSLKETEADGVVSLQCLSWLPEFEAPLEMIFRKIAPRWVAFSSLFYPGDISCNIEVLEHARARRTFYNVYSLPAIARFCAHWGYEVIRSEPFRIDIDLPKPSDPDLMATYTIPVRAQPDGNVERVQISGPLLMNWYCILIQKIGAPLPV